VSEILDRIEAILERMAASREAQQRQMAAQRKADQQHRVAQQRQMAAQLEADRQHRVAQQRQMAAQLEADRQHRVAQQQHRVAQWRDLAAEQKASQQEMTSLKSRVRSLDRIVLLDRHKVEQISEEISQMTADLRSLQVSNSALLQRVEAPDRDR